MTLRILERWKHRSRPRGLFKVLGHKPHPKPSLAFETNPENELKSIEQELTQIEISQQAEHLYATASHISESGDLSSIISPYENNFPSENQLASVLTPLQDHHSFSDPPEMPKLTIRAEDIDNISFLQDTVSHSTARNSLQNFSFQPEDATDVGSLSNAKIQTFKPYRGSRRSLKLVSPFAASPTIHCIDEVEKVESHINEASSLELPCTAVCDTHNPFLRSP